MKNNVDLPDFFGIFVDGSLVKPCKTSQEALIFYRGYCVTHPDSHVCVMFMRELTRNPFFLHCLDDDSEK